jgi:aminoglycoside 3-N-acetyltransferase
MQESKPVIRRKMIEAGLRGLGLGADDLMVVHSSLSSFGWVDGGADTAIEALLAAVAPSWAAIGVGAWPGASSQAAHPEQALGQWWPATVDGQWNCGATPRILPLPPP